MSEFDGANVMIDFTRQITLIRMLRKSLLPVRMTLRAEVFPSETARELDFDLTFAKIKFWLDTVVSSAVAFCRENALARSMLLAETGRPQVVNHLMITPSEPTDEHLAALFQAKMGALSGGSMEFGTVRIETDSAGLVFNYIGDWRDDLPAMQDWFDTKPYYFDEPWWMRDDASSLDVMIAGDDPAQPPPWAYRLDFLTAVQPQPAKPPVESEDDVVIRGVFRPKVIHTNHGDPQE